ncbi:proteasome assembly chaperone family protein [Natronomonas gomsonensis]|uniref:proteasome assembly chaperone family protein n=1 Tax=Natronomonas gomsonensis TaxID=1046043 RepID=UPI0015BC95EB|nr:PAC2 family protein [Natronomonas gomsonensis]
MVGQGTSPSFDIQHEEPTSTLVAGFAEFGLAGLTAANYVTETLELERTGHIGVEQLPAVTPFENGTPRHHTRLFSKPDLDITVVVGELFVPPYAAEPFGNALLDYTDEHGVEDIVVLSGVPIQHGPDDHRAFYVASEDYQSARLDGDHGITAMPGGFLDGINGELMERAVDSTLKACVLTTPVHQQVPDIDAALRLIGALDSVYDLDIDTGPLEEFAETLSKQYEELAARLESQREEMRPEDRMYM